MKTRKFEGCTMAAWKSLISREERSVGEEEVREKRRASVAGVERDYEGEGEG